MARTYDEMILVLKAARPDLADDLKVTGLVAVLDEHFPVEGGWRNSPLHDGVKRLREAVAAKNGTERQAPRRCPTCGGALEA